MQFKTLALATTSLVALGLTVAPATAKTGTAMMGDLNLGFSESWEDFGFGGESDFDIQYPAVFGGGHVNLPYSENINIQLDAVGRGSLDQSFFSGKGSDSSPSQVMYFALGSHLNYRDERGLLGIFGAVGRTNDTFGDIAAPIFMFGFDGQYFCEQWTFRAQLAYLDADESFLLKSAGSIRGGVNYYASKQLKLTGDLAYIAGQQSPFGTSDFDVREWAWAVGVHYWFGKTMPVSAFVEYRGRSAETDFGSEGDADLDQNSVNAGVVFHFGGEDFMDADRNGASTDLPDIDWYRLEGESIS